MSRESTFGIPIIISTPRPDRRKSKTTHALVIEDDPALLCPAQPPQPPRPDRRKAKTTRRSCVRLSLRSPQDQTAEKRRRPGALVSGSASAAPQKSEDDPALLCPAQPPQPPRPDRTMSDAESASAAPETKPQAEEAPNTTDVEDDPALFIVYNDESVHDSLALPNSPVVQRGTVAASSAAFQRYVYDVLLTTGVEESANCLRDMSTAGRGTYFPFVVHRLQQDQYRNVLDKLLHHFVLAGTPVSAWSQAVPAPLGKLFKVTGGTGLGAAYVSQEMVFAGVFRNA